MDTRVIVGLTGAISTNMDQSKETGQLEWQHVESHHTVSASSSVWGEAPPVQHKLHVWPDLRQENPVDMRKQIFCNRSLNMKSIVAVGFDMDYTLAQYKPETFESMAYTGTIQKLVNDLGYPKEVGSPPSVIRSNYLFELSLFLHAPTVLVAFWVATFWDLVFEPS